MMYKTVELVINMKGIFSEMVKTVVVRKRNILVYGIIVVVLAVLSVVIRTYLMDNSRSEYITYAFAARMIAYAQVDDCDSFVKDAEWYSPYMEYVNMNEYMNAANPNDYVKYKDISVLASRLNAPDDCLKLCGIDSYKAIEYDNRIVKRDIFIKCFNNLCRYFKYGSEIKIKELGIAGLPKDTLNEEWMVYTTEGSYIYDGIIINPYIDTTIEAITRADRLLCVVDKKSDDVWYANVLLKSYEDGYVNVNIYGITRRYKVRKVDGFVENSLANIYIGAGKLKEIDIKSDVISGKVLSANETFIEIEGYGKIPVDDNFMIYDVTDGDKISGYDSVIVGYSLEDFVVAQGKICGAVKGRKLVQTNIRVMLKTTGYKQLFHDSVEVDSDVTIHMLYNDTITDVWPGEHLVIDKSDERLKSGRIKLYTDNGSIRIDSIKRGQGYPWYEGQIELALYDDGIAVVNEVDIEEYLKYVVPSEMPVSYGVNALKCQAVCARSYAYTQLENNYYGEYGAHVDDSVSFQVYNNTNRNNDADIAVDQTRGKAVYYNGEIVKTYYYSTSCGYSTDVCAWGSDDEGYPMYGSTHISRIVSDIDMRDDTCFEQYITEVHNDDYDSEFPLYRWNTTISIKDISDNINSKLAYASARSNVYTYDQNGNKEHANVSNVGKVQSLDVIKRGCGGVASEILVRGSDSECVIAGENTIRTVLGSNKFVINTQSGETHYDILPSAFITVKPVYSENDDKYVTAYKINGGGYGHGIGMSQNAVRKMSETMDYEDILKVFYKNVQIKSVTSS